jgi:hypothetical protein
VLPALRAQASIQPKASRLPPLIPHFAGRISLTGLVAQGLSFWQVFMINGNFNITCYSCNVADFNASHVSMFFFVGFFNSPHSATRELSNPTFLHLRTLCRSTWNDTEEIRS